MGIARTITAIGAAYLLYLAALFLLQRFLLFPGQLRSASDDVPARVVVHWIETRSGPVEAWYLPAVRSGDEGPGPAILFTHGNGELIEDWAGPMEAATRLGFGVLLVEYPGYGRSSGRPSEKSIRPVVSAAFDWLAARAEIDGARIIAYGRSVGGGAACLLARDRDIAALVLQSAFTGTRPYAKRFGAPSALIRDPFDNVAAVAAFEGPVLVVHGRHDDMIPFAHGEALARAAGVGRFVADECRHNDCPSDWDAFWGYVRELSDGVAPRHGDTAQ